MENSKENRIHESDLVKCYGAEHSDKGIELNRIDLVIPETFIKMNAKRLRVPTYLVRKKMFDEIKRIYLKVNWQRSVSIVIGLKLICNGYQNIGINAFY